MVEISYKLVLVWCLSRTLLTVSRSSTVRMPVLLCLTDRVLEPVVRCFDSVPGLYGLYTHSALSHWPRASPRCILKCKLEATAMIRIRQVWTIQWTQMNESSVSECRSECLEFVVRLSDFVDQKLRRMSGGFVCCEGTRLKFDFNFCLN